MKPRRIILIFFVVVVLVGVLALILWSTYIGTGIQTSPQETQLVYDVWVHSGQRYNNVLYPKSEDTLYMISTNDNVITPKLTEVYYWTLTSEYKADWSALDEKLVGVIEIKQGNKSIEFLERTQYSLVYSNITPKEIVFGEQAVESYQQ